MEQGESPPRNLGAVTNAIGVQLTTVDQMADDTVGVISALVLGPVHRLAGIVLIVADFADVGYLGDCIGEVVEHAASDGEFLTFGRIFR